MSQDNIDWIKVRDELEHLTFQLGLYENRLLLEIARRLKLGQDTYGEFTEQKIKNGDWNKEASEEFFDAVVYVTVESMKRRMNDEV